MFDKLKSLVDELTGAPWQFNDRTHAVNARKALQVIKKEVQNCRVKVLQARKNTNQTKPEVV